MKTIADSFSEQNFLSKISGGKSVAKYTPKKPVFRQGDTADAIFYIQKGKVKLGVVSKRGKEAVVAILGPGDFIGEGALAGQPSRMSSATPLTDCPPSSASRRTRPCGRYDPTPSSRKYSWRIC